MEKEKRTDFCIQCRKDTEYELKKIPTKQVIRDKEYEFFITTAYCKECGEEMSIPGLFDKNAQEIDAQYREQEGIATVDDIQKLMKLYNLGKAPLSLALGFGEVTITRYLAGQIPSKEYSDIIRKALIDYEYMKKLVIANRKKLGEKAYRKAMAAITELNALYTTVTPKLLTVISYLFESLEEVTPLMLQKLLYYVQGIHLALFGVPVFAEDCEAWVHGPVYRNVYMLFRDFKYSPIDDDKFSLLQGYVERLSNTEKHVIDLVVKTFGIYSGKTLESITHKETPWIEMRKGYLENEPSSEELSKDSIREYFNRIQVQFDINTESGLNKYIRNMLCNS